MPPRKPQLETPDQSAAARLVTIGLYLYGATWRRPLAEALGVSTRLVNDWEKGRRPIPQEHRQRLQELAVEALGTRLWEELARYQAALGLPPPQR